MLETPAAGACPAAADPRLGSDVTAGDLSDSGNTPLLFLPADQSDFRLTP